MEIKNPPKLIPEITIGTDIPQTVAEYFGERRISTETLKKAGIWGEMTKMPQDEKKVTAIAFPFIWRGVPVNIKYRDARKNFKLIPGAQLPFYNIDSVKGKKRVIIVEGEIDALSLMEAGIEEVISVPNGASGTNLRYLDLCHEDLDHIDEFIIATDQDFKGNELKSELIRRLGAEICSTVDWGDCKDANEYLVKYGVIALKDAIQNAKPVPVKDVVNLYHHSQDVYEYYLKGLQPGAKTGCLLDNLVTWETGRVCVVTGIPSHGKSTFIDYLIARLNIVNGWKAGICSPENFPVKLHIGKYMSLLTGKSFGPKFMDEVEYKQAYEYISNNFYWISPLDDMTLENILLKARYLVRRYGIKSLILDPYNKFDHSRDRGETETEYISRFLDRLTYFAQKNDLLIFLIAHPTKMQRDTKDQLKYMVPTLYDIAGSANFYNKADYGLVVHRDFETGKTLINVAKVRFRNWGDGGSQEFYFCKVNNRYDASTMFDFQSYIENKKTQLFISKNETNEFSPNL